MKDARANYSLVGEPDARSAQEAGMTVSICKRMSVIAGAGGVVLVVAGLAGSLLTGAWSVPQPADIRVIYVGADDCAQCRTWRQDHWPRFQVSAEFARLAYREVRSPRLFDLLKDDYWPEDLREYRNALERADGAPLWLVIAADQIVLKAKGLRQWEEVALPKIRSMVR